MRRLPAAFLLFVSTTSFAAVTGTVMDRDGKPIAAASISIFTVETADARRARFAAAEPEKAIAVAQSDAKGNFSIAVPKEHPVVEVRIAAPDFAPEGIRAETNDEIGAVSLTPAEMVRGTVKAGGKAVPNARLIWQGQNTHVTADTDAEGRYSVPNPARWASRVIVFHPDYARAEESPQGIGAPAKLKIDRTLDAGVEVKGRAVGIDGKTPVAKATVFIDGWPVGTTAEDGTFTVAHAPRRWEVLSIRTPALLGRFARKGDAPLTVRMSRAPVLTGTVRDAKSGAGIAGAEVRTNVQLSSDFGAITDAKGNFTIAGLEPGRYSVMTIHPGYSATPSPITVSPGQTVSRSLSVAPNARISGTVIDEEKQPVSAAAVVARPAARDDMPPMMMTMAGIGRPGFGAGRSGPDGRFVVRVAAPETEIQATATKRGYPTAASSPFRVIPGERKSGVAITIPRGIEITGQVTDRDGKPLSGVSVVAAEAVAGPGGGPMRRQIMFGAMQEREADNVRTVSDGTFSIRVKEGRHDIAFQREGFAPKTIRSVEAATATRPLTVTLDPGAEITGRVTRGGTGVEGVRVQVFGESAGSTTTAADGSFRLPDLAPGQLMLMLMKDSDFIEERRTVTAPAADVNIDLPSGGRVSGRVVDATTKQPITQFQAGINVSRSGGGMRIMRPPQMRSFTSDDGTFVLENVPPGPTEVAASAPGYLTATTPNVTVEDGKTVTDLEIALSQGAKLSGRVTGPDGAALSGVMVRIVTDRSAPALNEGYTTTDSSGEYLFESVEPGERRLSFDSRGYLGQQKTIEIKGREARLDVQLSSGVRATGVVVTEAGVPVAEARIRATGGSGGSFGSPVAVSDSSGNFVLEGMAPGHYTLTATKTGFANGIVRDADITTGPVRIVMKSGGVIYGQVRGLAASELGNVMVRATAPSGNATAVVDPSGSYRIEGAPTGTVRVSAMSGGGFGGSQRTSPTVSVQVEPGSSAVADIDFTSGNTVSGRVLRNGQPLPGVAVMFIRQESGPGGMVRVTADGAGRYTVNGLEDGSYRVDVLDMQRLTPYSTKYEVRGGGNFDIDLRTTNIRGQVRDASTGEPLPAASVTIDNSSDPMPLDRAATTDASGIFVFNDVSAGTYQARVEKEGYGNSVEVITIADSGNDSVVFKLTKSSGITIRVVDARDNRDLNASVQVFDAGNRLVYDDMFRFGSGTSRLPLATGTYRAVVFAPGYASRSMTISSPSNLTIGLTPGGTLLVKSRERAMRRARLLDATGQPVLRSRTGIFTIDPAPGVTQLNNVAPGAYTLQILDTNDAVLHSAPVSVIEGRVVDVEI